MLRRAFFSFFLGFGIFILGVVLKTVLDRLGVGGVPALIDDLLIGILAGTTVFAYERRQHKLVLARMRMIADMNHHVRNALQQILYSPFLKEETEQIRLIQEGTRRIEWALKEVLPGEGGVQSSPKSKSAA